MSEDSVAFMFQREQVVRARSCFNVAYETRDFDDLLNALDEIIELHEWQFGVRTPREERIKKSLDALDAPQPTILSTAQWKTIVEDKG